MMGGSNINVLLLSIIMVLVVGSAESYYFPYDAPESSIGFTQSDTDGFDSDLLRLSIQNSTIIPDAKGLFSKKNISMSDDVVKILCEFRGFLIPMASVFPWSVVPSITNPVTQLSYGLEGNSVCHHVQDCVNLTSHYNPNVTTEGYDLYPNCSYNAMLRFDYGKAFLVPIREIKEGEEIFASFGMHYWAMKVGSFGVQGARELLIMNHPLVREAIHSDFLTVYTQPSLLPVPEIGLGVFAKHLIRAGSIIAENRGIAYPRNTTIQEVLSSPKLSAFGQNHYVLGTPPSALVNDASWIYNRLYNSSELVSIYHEDVREYGVLPDTPGYTTNVARVMFTSDPQEDAALFLMATTDIPAGAEMYCSYGKSYWKYALFRHTEVENSADKQK